MNHEGIIRLILALTIPLFMLLVFALEYSKGYQEFDEGSQAIITMWKDVLLIIIGGLLGRGTVVNKKDDGD